MQPALNPNRGSEDYVFLSRWAVKDLDIERGDIISVVSPKDPNQTLIKRIVAMQGNFFVLAVVVVIANVLIVLVSGDIVSTIGYKKPFVKIPEGHCWIEGDHTGVCTVSLIDRKYFHVDDGGFMVSCILNEKKNAFIAAGQKIISERIIFAINLLIPIRSFEREHWFSLHHLTPSQNL